VGRTPEGFGYVLVGSLLGDETEYQKFEGAIRSVLDAPALILDLRACKGGQESWAQRVTAILSGASRPYARSAWRAGRAHDQFYETAPRRVPVSSQPAYAGPVAVLIGPGCVSSGEGFALALRSLPGATLLGQPTRGASGNPQPLALPIGVTVSYSRWIARGLDGTSIERRGVPPDVPIEPAEDRDAVLAEARAHLSRATHRPESGDR
jgi:C-terminal processing protease CtpA/Prc